MVGPRLLPEYRDPEPGRFDIASAGLSLVSVLTVIYGVKQIAEGGLGTGAALSISVGVLVGIAFLHRQRTASDPMLDLELFRVPAFSAALGANGLALFAVFGMDLFVAQYLQLGLGMGPLEAGLWTLPAAAGFIVGSNAAPLIAGRVSTAHVVAGGLALTGLGLAILTQVGQGAELPVLVAGSVAMGIGAAHVLTLSTDLVVRLGATGAGRDGVRDLRDGHGAGRSARDRDPGQPRHGRLPPRDRRHAPAGRAGGRRGHARRSARGRGRAVGERRRRCHRGVLQRGCGSPRWPAPC